MLHFWLSEGFVYNVMLTKKCSGELVRLKKKSLISESELIIVRTWISEMKNFGPDYIANCEHWDDHELKNKRAKERSSSFSLSGRIIYRVKKSRIDVTIIRITPDHNYK